MPILIAWTGLEPTLRRTVYPDGGTGAQRASVASYIRHTFISIHESSFIALSCFRSLLFASHPSHYIPFHACSTMHPPLSLSLLSFALSRFPSRLPSASRILQSRICHLRSPVSNLITGGDANTIITFIPLPYRGHTLVSSSVTLGCFLEESSLFGEGRSSRSLCN